MSVWSVISFIPAIVKKKHSHLVILELCLINPMSKTQFTQIFSLKSSSCLSYTSHPSTNTHSDTHTLIIVRRGMSETKGYYRRPAIALARSPCVMVICPHLADVWPPSSCLSPSHTSTAERQMLLVCICIWNSPAPHKRPLCSCLHGNLQMNATLKKGPFRSVCIQYRQSLCVRVCSWVHTSDYLYRCVCVRECVSDLCWAILCNSPETRFFFFFFF